MSNIVGVRFFSQTRVYHFDANDLELNKDDLVIVSTAKGTQIGKVEKLWAVVDSNYEYAPVLRLATEKDLDRHKKIEKQEKEALLTCREIVQEEGLEMKVVDARYSFDKKTLTFSFFADRRVDFRELLKILAKTFKTRIELLQIGVRDKAKEVGGIGSCGQELCCARFLNQMDNISINMAKNQDLSLNPSKINGVCGRLLCCLNYENEYYKECKKNMPKVGEKIKTEKGEGTVLKIDCLKRIASVELANNEVVEVEVKNGNNK